MISKQRLLLHPLLHITRQLLFVYTGIRINIALLTATKSVLSAAVRLEVRIVLGYDEFVAL
jgi:hypothetical protein